MYFLNAGMSVPVPWVLDALGMAAKEEPGFSSAGQTLLTGSSHSSIGCSSGTGTATASAPSFTFELFHSETCQKTF